MEEAINVDLMKDGSIKISNSNCFIIITKNDIFDLYCVLEDVLEKQRDKERNKNIKTA